ncbi:MAG: polyphosphate polymerase domain-containing protein [Oscillospiraceae bacterium]|nr:polyphosphate polymerase domain-containing protein [Oscillospiraceae bacterium]
MNSQTNRTYSVLRTEKKYELPLQQAALIADRLARIMQADIHSGVGGYAVRSLYFDSIYDDDLMDKINGLEKRKKVRLRIYRPEQESVKLELKQKQGSAQRKDTLEISREAALALIAGHFDPLRELSDPLAAELYALMHAGVYRPKCIIEYSRRAFAAPTNDTRITIDSDIRVSRDFDRFFRAAPAYSPVLKHPVLEVKYNRFLLDTFKFAVNLAGIPEMSCSKYELSRSRIG